MEAYVLIQTEIGKPLQVAEEVGRIPEVISVAVVTGPYDVVARVGGADIPAIGKLSLTSIQAVEGVARTLTCPVLHL